MSHIYTWVITRANSIILLLFIFCSVTKESEQKLKEKCDLAARQIALLEADLLQKSDYEMSIQKLKEENTGKHIYSIILNYCNIKMFEILTEHSRVNARNGVTTTTSRPVTSL